MGHTPCPHCGSEINAKYDGTSWCRVCVERVLDEQEQEAVAPVEKEIIET
jgi:uncharacterized Zn finger protein (UPF0148 family)